MITNIHDQTYNRLLTTILEQGVQKGDRTGTGTISVFGEQAKFDLSKGFPLLTTKKMFWRAIVAELLWFIQGDTNVRTLGLQGINKIWHGNGYDHYKKNLAPARGETPLSMDDWAARLLTDEKFAVWAGDLGEVYGAQWRRWGHAKKPGEVIDQLAEVIARIKSKPDDRRLIITAWNPSEIETMALPPCHCLFQFYTRPLWHGGRALDCQLYQRSADTFLGVPFNIASYSLLLAMIANECDMQPGVFTHTYGDLHIYSNHVDQVKEQLTRTSFAAPTLKLAKKSLFEMTAADIELVGYEAHATIKADMAV